MRPDSESAPATTGAAKPGAGETTVRRLARRYLLSAAVFAVIAAVSVVTAVALRGVVHNQERRLLDERAAELAAYLRSTTTQAQATLAAAGSAVAFYGGDSPLFESLARSLNRPGATVSVLQQRGSTFVTIGGYGPNARTGRPVPADHRRMVQRAAATTGLVFEVFVVDGLNHYVEALKVPASVPTVVMIEGVLGRPRPIPTTEDSPYRELDVALYTGTKAVPQHLILISGALPKPSQHPVRLVTTIGADKLLIVTAGHEPLVGAFAASVPWVVLAGGLVLAGLVALLVQVLSRRRAYAMRLVEERTREMYQAQMAAEAANRSKSEFLSRMSHELRTPLNAVLGFGQLLEMDELTRDQEEAVAHITKGGRHLLDLINEILDISQIETGRLAVSPEPVRVRDVVGESVGLIGPLAAERGIGLVTDVYEAGDEHVLADRQRLKQILLNLIGNGIKYNRDGGTVAIGCTHPRPGVLRIEVADTGPGIPAEQFDLLFTPFERLGAERTTVPGTGIGLALSRRLAEVMGGTLGVDSTLGRGSTFWVDLPLAEAPTDPTQRLREPAPAGSGTPLGEPPAVLHIEDNLANIQLIERVLNQRPGLRLIPAMQGRLGLDLARQHRPVLVLLDLDLADLSGEEVLGRLRADPATAMIPVAIMSADAMPRQVQRMLDAGATAYLTKPLDVRQLLELVDRCLAAAPERPSVAPAATGESARA